MSKIELEDKAFFVNNGGDFMKFKKQEIIELQDYALIVKDIDLYDKLEDYWKFKKFGR